MILFALVKLGFFVCFVALCPKSTAMVTGHGGTVSSPNHTFYRASLNKQLTSTSCTYFRLLQTTPLLERFSGRKENGHIIYFMINLHKSMDSGWDRTRDPGSVVTSVATNVTNRLNQG